MLKMLTKKIDTLEYIIALIKLIEMAILALIFLFGPIFELDDYLYIELFVIIALILICELTLWGYPLSSKK